eukprot:2565946-Pleurochrysis_carterae.AAC.4
MKEGPETSFSLYAKQGLTRNGEIDRAVQGKTFANVPAATYKISLVDSAPLKEYSMLSDAQNCL